MEINSNDCFPGSQQLFGSLGVGQKIATRDPIAHLTSEWFHGTEKNTLRFVSVIFVHPFIIL